MDLLPRFRNYIQENGLFHAKDRLLLAVSGGVDSVTLCELCRQAGYDYTIVHCNFRLRGEESSRDEAFVQDLARRQGVKFLLKRFDTHNYASQNKLSVQVAARELRYQWFGELLDGELGEGYSYIVTAHHLDDNLETLLMNFFKGTGIAGLRGILPKQGRILRPLLFAKKEELIAFAVENQLNWVEDSSNDTDKYSRNYVRHNIIPLLRNIFPEVENNLAANLQRFRDIELLYGQAIDIHKKKLVEQMGNEFHIPVLKLLKSAPVRSIVYEIIKDFGFHASQVDEVIQLTESESGKYIASSSHRIIRNRNWLIIAPVAAAETGMIIIDNETSQVEFRDQKLHFEWHKKSDIAINAEKEVAWLDAREIKFPLILRPWKTGDYFYPLGMKKKKKLARFFIDQKLSKTTKEKIWVLETNKKIAWVIGQRIDDRFKVTEKTKDLLKITLD